MLEPIVKSIIGDSDIYLYGFANLAGLLNGEYAKSGLNYAIAIAYHLDNAIINQIQNGPIPEYRNHYKEVNANLCNVIHEMSDILTKKHIRNLPINPTIDEKDFTKEFEDTLRSPFSHKMAATRAGLGWIGKTDLLITKNFGPRVRLVTILVEYNVLQVSQEINKSQCGECRICVDACPAKAANRKSWDIHTDRNEFYDAFKCKDMCRQLSLQNLNEVISICGICVSVCPFGKKMNEQHIQ